MKFKINQKDENKLIKLLDTRNINMDVANVYNDLFKYEQDEEIFDIDGILENIGFDLEEEETQEIISKYQIRDIKQLNLDKYLSNLYYKTIKFPEITVSNITLFLDQYRPYEIFLNEDIKINKGQFYQEILSAGYFTKPYHFPAVAKDKTVWMSITPHEINTMEKSILEAKGNVLVLGLGLGYYPFMVSMKDDVKNVYVVEKDKNIIDLFNKHLLNQFPHKEKIHILYKDGFDALKNDINNIDYIFIDLWHDSKDGLPLYIKAKKMLKDSSIKTSYWIEESLKTGLRRNLLCLIEEEYFMNTNDNDYLKSKTPDDKIINKLHFILKDKDINSYQDIEKLISDESLDKLIQLL